MVSRCRAIGEHIVKSNEETMTVVTCINFALRSAIPKGPTQTENRPLTN